MRIRRGFDPDCKARAFRLVAALFSRGVRLLVGGQEIMVPLPLHSRIVSAGFNDMQRQNAWPRVQPEWLNALQRVLPAAAPG